MACPLSLSLHPLSPPLPLSQLLGPRGLTGVLGGSLAVCFMMALMMANAGGAWDNSKKWCEKCGEEGEPKEVGSKVKVFTRFGIKKAALFDELLHEHGYEAMFKDPKEAASTPARTNPAAREALRDSLVKLYKDRHGSTVVGDTLGDPFKVCGPWGGLRAAMRTRLSTTPANPPSPPSPPQPSPHGPRTLPALPSMCSPRP
jgi:hypothetical protein